MRSFTRSLKYSWPYRSRIILSLVSALCVAALWGLSLSAIYPVLKIFSAEKNLQIWVDEEITNLTRKANDPAVLKQANDLRAAIAYLNEHPESPDRDNVLRRNTKDLATIEGDLEYANTWIYRYQLLRDKVIRYMPTNPFQTFCWIIGWVIVGVALRGFFEFWQESLIGVVVCRTLFDLRNHFYRTLVHQDTRQIQDPGTAELMARMTNDLEQVGGGMKILYGKMIVEPLKAITCIAAACFISWQLTLLFLVLVVPAVATLGRVSRLMKKASRKVLEGMSSIYKILRETFDGIRVVKAFTMESAERTRFRRATEEYFRKSARVVRIDAATGPVVETLGVAAVGLALLAGAYLVLEKKTSIFGLKMTDTQLGYESLIQLYVFLAAIADPVRRLSSVYTKIQSGDAAAERVFALFDRVPAVLPNANGPGVPKHEKAIEFRRVCFSYVPGQDPSTITDVNLAVAAGETIAIVGPNGCGKSTLIGMLARFYDPDSGAVLVDGVNLRTARLRSLRKQIGLVTQDTLLFDDTILANIAYGKPGATPTEVEAAARKAYAHDFIVARPNGYAEKMGDAGSQFSGGQKQRIALARAILRDPRILILDEATSQIDPESEVMIHRALEDFKRGRTTFLITHRKSTLDLADRIVVMDAGRIVGVGTHADLAVSCEVYRRLYEGQIADPQSAARAA